MSLKYCVGVYLALTLVSFGSGGIRKELRSSQRVDLKESTIHLQHRIVHIIVIYVFCTLLKSYQY
jgi:23S rRNA pseudoU1915 N3-methylase RlmH